MTCDVVALKQEAGSSSCGPANSVAGGRCGEQKNWKGECPGILFGQMISNKRG